VLALAVDRQASSPVGVDLRERVVHSTCARPATAGRSCDHCFWAQKSAALLSHA